MTASCKRLRTDVCHGSTICQLSADQGTTTALKTARYCAPQIARESLLATCHQDPRGPSVPAPLPESPAFDHSGKPRFPPAPKLRTVHSRSPYRFRVCPASRCVPDDLHNDGWTTAPSPAQAPFPKLSVPAFGLSESASPRVRALLRSAGSRGSTRPAR